MGIIGTSVWTVLAALLCLGAGLTCLWFGVARGGDRVAGLTHAVMGVAMAGMFAPWGDPVPAWAGVAVFGVLGAWFGAAVLRGARGDAVYLAIASAAMVLMYPMHHDAPASAGTPMAGPHAGHMMMMSGGAPGLVVLPLALLLAGYFVWHAWNCADRARAAAASAASSGGGATAVRTRVRLEPAAHGVMSVLMAAMFLGAV